MCMPGVRCQMTDVNQRPQQALGIGIASTPPHQVVRHIMTNPVHC
jgi:hypothetical protein